MGEGIYKHPGGLGTYAPLTLSFFALFSPKSFLKILLSCATRKKKKKKG